MVQLSHPYMTTRKTIALTIRIFVSNVMSLLFNTLSGFVIVFLPRSKLLLFPGCSRCLQWFWSPRKKSLSLFPLFLILFAMKWWDRMPWSFFWMLTFKPGFSFSTFTFIKRLFGYSVLPALRVVLSAYLRLLIFLPAVLIPACDSSSPVFCMMYSAYKLNKQGDNMQPWCTQTTIQLHSFHMLAKLCSKSFKIGFSRNPRTLRHTSWV